MRKMIAVLLAAAVMSGCVTDGLNSGAPVQAHANTQGGSVGVNPLQINAIPGWLMDNWGKVATGVILTGGVYLYGDHNGWWGKEPSTGQGNSTTDASVKTETKTNTKTYEVSIKGDPDIQGDGNRVIYNMYFQSPQQEPAVE